MLKTNVWPMDISTILSRNDEEKKCGIDTHSEVVVGGMREWERNGDLKLRSGDRDR